MSTYYFGLSTTYHDPGLAIVSDGGEILFAEATERYLQNKRAINSEPDQLLYIHEVLTRFCPNPDKLVIASNWHRKRPFYENFIKKIGSLSAERLLKTGIKKLYSPLPNYKLHHMMACQRNCIERTALNLIRIIGEHFPNCEVTFKDYDHHLTHAAIACYGSGFDETACAVIDSYGEQGAMAFYRFKDAKLQCIHSANGLAQASLGLLYMKITELCGFDWLKGEEWKVMGLASYGMLDVQLYDLLSSLFVVQGLDCKHPTPRFFQQLSKLDAYQQQSDSPLMEKANIAFTGQAFFSDLLTQILDNLHKKTAADYLTLAGGCALNSSFNGQITQRTGFKALYVPPAPADDGCALGAAWLAYHERGSNKTKTSKPVSAYLGSVINEETLERFILHNRSLTIDHLPGEIAKSTARLLTEGKLVGWIQGRAEYGPRALGNRSILADPRPTGMQDLINEKIKFREVFRPFAPAVLHEYAEQYFEDYQESPYMDKTLRISKGLQDKIPAVCHVDGTGRLQTVKQAWNPLFYELINEFYGLTQIPLVLNTSFNVMGKPLIHSLEDALSVFMTTGLDVLVVGDYLISKPKNE